MQGVFGSVTLGCAYSLDFLLFTIVFVLAELAGLDADQYVFVVVRRDVVSHYQLSVLLRPHTQVAELTVLLIQLFQRTLSFHYQIANEGAVLHRREIFGEVLHGDAVEVDQHVPNGSRLLHQVVQRLLYFSFLSSSLNDRKSAFPGSESKICNLTQTYHIF